MGKYSVIIESSAKSEIISHYKFGDKANIKKSEKILQERIENPYSGFGNPEAHKHNLLGFCSRKMNQKDRLIYKVEDDVVTVFVISAMGNYGSK